MTIYTNRINTITERTDKNGNSFLILTLVNRETILVFPKKINQERWKELKEGNQYEFSTEESTSNRGEPSKLLTDFKEIK